MNFRRALVPGLAAILILAAFACKPLRATRPPKEDPQDPTLASVGDTSITASFIKLALSNMPIALRTKYMTEEGKKEYLERLIDTMTYYHEGLLRGLDKKIEYQNRMDKAQKLTLIRMAKDALFDKLPPPSSEEIEKAYDVFKKREERDGRTAKPLSEVTQGIVNTLNSEHYQKAYKDRVKNLKEEYGLKVHEEILDKPLREADLNALLIESRAFNFTMADYITWAKTLPGQLRALASTPEGRKFLVDLYDENELLYYDALLQKLDKTPEFDKRMFVGKVAILGQIAIDDITSKNIGALNKEAQEYFEKHPDKFKGATWEQGKEKAKFLATGEKKERITKELAFALRRDRYPLKRNEENIKKLDLSSVTKGEFGLMVYPTLPPGTEIVDLNEIKLPGKSPDQPPPDEGKSDVPEIPGAVSAPAD